MRAIVRRSRRRAGRTHEAGRRGVAAGSGPAPSAIGDGPPAVLAVLGRRGARPRPAGCAAARGTGTDGPPAAHRGRRGRRTPAPARAAPARPRRRLVRRVTPSACSRRRPGSPADVSRRRPCRRCRIAPTRSTAEADSMVMAASGSIPPSASTSYSRCRRGADDSRDGRYGRQVRRGLRGRRRLLVLGQPERLVVLGGHRPRGRVEHPARLTLAATGDEPQGHHPRAVLGPPAVPDVLLDVDAAAGQALLDPRAQCGRRRCRLPGGAA